MNTDYADAIIAFDDAIYEAGRRARDTLTDAEIAAELRRLADEWETE